MFFPLQLGKVILLLLLPFFSDQPILFEYIYFSSLPLVKDIILSLITHKGGPRKKLFAPYLLLVLYAWSGTYKKFCQMQDANGTTSPQCQTFTLVLLDSSHRLFSWGKEEHLSELSPYFADLVEAVHDPRIDLANPLHYL